MRKEKVLRVYKNWEELSEEEKAKEVENSYGDYILVQSYYDMKLTDFNYELDILKEKYNVDFELKIFDRSTAIKDIIFKEEPFEFRLDKILIDEYHESFVESDIELYKDKLKTLNFGFLSSVRLIIEKYDELFLDYIGDDFEPFVVDDFIYNEVEFLVEETVIDSKGSFNNG